MTSRLSVQELTLEQKILDTRCDLHLENGDHKMANSNNEFLPPLPGVPEENFTENRMEVTTDIHKTPENFEI